MQARLSYLVLEQDSIGGTISHYPRGKVVLSYRGAAFNRVKAKNRQRLDVALANGLLDLRLESKVREITRDSVYLTQGGEELRLPNDHVIICAGGLLPKAFLESIGVAVQTHYGTAA